MKLFDRLQNATSEEDVKDIYIKALGLKEYQKNLIDIQTKEIWFEAKQNSKLSSYEMFTQLMHYVQDALNKGDYIPPFLVVMDTRKAAIMKSVDVLPFLAKKTIKWGKSASGYTQDALDAISAHIGTHFVSFKIETHEDEFISTVKNAIKNGDIIRTPITPDNLKQVFDKWVSMIGREIKGVAEENYALLFFADIMHDGTISTHQNLPAELLHKNGAPVFNLGNINYELGNKEGYRQFWAIYNKPPKAEYRNYLLERRDTLIALDERSFKGAYYTPLVVVDKAYDKLEESLGVNWQRNYVVWDMCCGVGNLEVKHSNPRNIYMSTLDQADIDVMKATKTCVAAQRFQYDYLNDDINEFGEIDYNISNKVPFGLRQAIAEGKKILVLINPPYAEAANSLGNEAKTDVAATKVGRLMNKTAYGYAARELFIQFVARITKEIPNATLAMFSTLKYVNSPNFEKFRQVWNAEYLGGFIVHSKVFEGLKGNFPIGFLIWKTSQIGLAKKSIIDISVEVLDKNAVAIGEKHFYNFPNIHLLTNWIGRQKPNNIEAIPLINAVTPTTQIKGVRRTTWADNAIGHMLSDSNDLQNALHTGLFSSVHSIGHKGGFFVTTENLWQSAVIFCVRRLIKPTWLNDRDQFLQPTKPLSTEFKNDCLVWMLFNGSNLTASADDLDWNGRKWSIVNHFIPYTESEVNSPDRFESDFMVEFMRDLQFSSEASSVLDQGKKLWQAYFDYVDVRSVRDKLKLNRPDVGWYQIRKALQSRNASGDFPTVSFADFEVVYKLLSEKLRPLVYEYGFLKS
ncbi:hypothetical protein [Mucilaginibacter sp. PAMB04168]|uniref:hypothetical protein n=1 Tax=Mucilaginibacter sp. PAMB04168 TaxID=3138567 RepID=UPI0031F635EF